MGGVDDREPVPALGLEELEDGVARLRVDPDRRLVAQEVAWLVQQARDDIEAPLHSAGIILHPPLPAIPEADGLQEHACPLADLPRLHPVDAAEDAEVLQGAELRIERDRLRHEAQSEARDGAMPTRQLPPDPDGAGVGREDPGKHVHERGLAGAVRPEQAEEQALGNLQADLSQGLDAAEAFADPGDLNHRPLRLAPGDGRKPIFRPLQKAA